MFGSNIFYAENVSKGGEKGLLEWVELLQHKYGDEGMID